MNSVPERIHRTPPLLEFILGQLIERTVGGPFEDGGHGTDRFFLGHLTLVEELLYDVLCIPLFWDREDTRGREDTSSRIRFSSYDKLKEIPHKKTDVSLCFQGGISRQAQLLALR